MHRFRWTLTCALLLPAVAAGQDGYLLAANLQFDDGDGAAASLFGDFGVSERARVSASVGHNSVELPFGRESDTLYVDLGLDYFIDPAGFRFSVAYWGDPDLLDSVDLRGSLYFRGNGGSLSLDVERRDFEFQFPAFDFLPQTRFPFDATGVGLNATVRLSESVDLHAGAKHYDYSVAFQPQQTDRIRRLFSISRLSVVSSLVDWQVTAGIGVDIGSSRLALDAMRWRGVIDDSDNDSLTLSILIPLSDRFDIELGVGEDRSDQFGNVTVGSLLLLYYGGN